MTTNTQQQLPDVPLEYTGKWVAWNDERTRIIARGSDIAEVRAAARQAGATQPLLEKAPQPNTHYLGRF